MKINKLNILIYWCQLIIFDILILQIKSILQIIANMYEWFSKIIKGKYYWKLLKL